MSQSPCATCPKAKWCENKLCPRWRAFMQREWKKFNNYYNKYKEVKK